MRKLLLIAGVAALALPSVAAAQPGCAQQRHDNRVAGTVIGAGLGAVLGSAVASHGDRGAGGVIGAVGGGAIGNVAGGAATPCDGYTQAGYYDGNGVWQAGPGHYDANGEWQSASGYYDGAGNWIDASPPPATATTPPPPDASDYGADVAYTGSSDDLHGRESWIEQRIHEGDSSGAVSRGDAEHDFDTLAGIRQFQARRAGDDGGLSREDRADVMNKLDNLTAILRSQWHY
jgi:hypothetical protein